MDTIDYITVTLPHATRIPFVTMATGEVGYIMSINGRITLMKGRIYKIPVNTTESLDTHHVFKPIGKFNEQVDIRNIENGYVSLLTLIPNVLIKDSQPVGYFI